MIFETFWKSLTRLSRLLKVLSRPRLSRLVNTNRHVRIIQIWIHELILLYTVFFMIWHFYFESSFFLIWKKNCLVNQKKLCPLKDVLPLQSSQHNYYYLVLKNTHYYMLTYMYLSSAEHCYIQWSGETGKCTLYPSLNYVQRLPILENKKKQKRLSLIHSAMARKMKIKAKTTKICKPFLPILL